ncbi:MAG: transketolase [Pseudomonadota bacterium]
MADDQLTDADHALDLQRSAHPKFWAMASALRALAMDAVEAAKSGHPGMPMGMADVATVLFHNHLKFDPSAPRWPDRDRFVLSAGHGSMLLYGLSHLTGYEAMPIEEIKNFRQLGSRTPGHPEVDVEAGIETTTGPLGQGLATAVGMAIAEQWLQQRFTKRAVDHHTYVIAGDGCLMEGVSQEAITLAGHLKLSKLIVLWDNNDISIDGPVSLSDSTDQAARFKAAGWRVAAIDGHNYDSIDAAIAEAKTAARPTLIACRTVIGFGAPKKAGTAGAHGAPLGAEEIAGARARYGWTAAPFEIPAAIASDWRAVGAKGADERTAWEERFATLSKRKQTDFLRMMAGEVPNKLGTAARKAKKAMIEAPATMATRKASQTAIEALVDAMPEMLGGSADLTGSNNTKAAGMEVISEGRFGGRYLHYGIREHGMAAAMNGMALHGGVAPYGGTFLVFTDYCRPAIRLSALMKQRVIYVMTHDSIGLGEDGPTHQPVEHLAALRAVPNLNVFRPADVVETLEAWELALSSTETPSIIALSRQNLPQARLAPSNKNMVAMGAYVLKDAPAPLKAEAVLIATGSEVSIALEAQALLFKSGIGARVISAPCLELFAAQDEKYRRRILPRGLPRIVIEAGVRQGWDGVLMGDRGDHRRAAFVGMTGFGDSAPAEALYQHFGITAEAAAQAVKSLVNPA